MTYGSLMASGAIAGLAGVIFSMKVGNYSSSTGPGLLFPALAAVFFGASQFTRRPNVWGTLVAYYTLAFGVKGLQLAFGPGTFWIQPLFQGARPADRRGPRQPGRRRDPPQPPPAPRSRARRCEHRGTTDSGRITRTTRSGPAVRPAIWA